MNQHLADISVSSTVGWETSSQDICSVKSNCVMEPCESVKCQYLKSQAIHHVVTLNLLAVCFPQTIRPIKGLEFTTSWVK